MRRYMKSKKRLLIITVLLGLSLTISGCSMEKKEKIPQYEGWKTYTYRHFVFYYPADSYWGKKMDSFSSAYERYLQEDCGFLGIDLPVDTIHFYIHAGGEEGRKLTGRDLPFHTKHQIHWDRMPPFGLELAKFLIDRMGIRETDYSVLYDGLAVLRDYSGEDYHHNASALIEMREYIPLDTLVNNESYARQNKHYREWEAASLVAFITFNYGINRFKMLWQSTASFDKSVKDLFSIDMKTFEEKWLEFAKQYFKGIQKEVIYQDSTALKK